MNDYNKKNVGASVLPSELGMYNTVMNTVLKYQNAMDMFTTHNTEKFYNVCIQGLDELTFDTYCVPQTMQISVRANKTAPLPTGYIDFIYMQIIDERGEVVEIVKNPKISGLGARNNQRPQEEEYPSSLYNNSFFETLFGYYSADNVPGALGFGGMFNKYGEFKIDASTQTILLPTNFPYEKLVLHYMSNDANKNSEGEYVVHVFAEMALLRWADWFIKSLNTKKFSLGEIQLAEQYKNEARGLAVSRFASFTEEEFLETMTLQIKLAAKS